MKHEERLKNFYEYMDSPEGKLSLENHFKELEEEHKKILDFFESEEV